jgi:hypothetical protein
MGTCPSTFEDGAADATHESNDVKKNFLKLHKPEREAKWILDRVQVGEALMYQADEMMRIEGLRNGIYQANQNGEYQNGALLSRTETRAETVVSGIFSDFTTASTATTPMGNVNKYEPRAMAKMKDLNQRRDKANALYQDGGESDEDDFVIKPVHLHGNSNKQQINSEQFATAERKQEGVFKLYSNLLKCSQPKEGRQIRREELMSVLHLKMKAHLGLYYLNRYSRMFPDSFVQSEMRRRSKDVPFLVLNDSEDSSSSASGGHGSAEFESSRHSSPIYYATSDVAFMDLAFTGSLGLIPKNDQSPRTTNSPKRNQKSPDHYLVLVDRRSGVPIAVCARKVDSSGAPPVVRVYATKRRVFGQRSAATTEKLGLDWGGNALPLYAWAEIVTESMFPNPLKFSIFMASGSDGQFSLQPNFHAAFSEDGQPIIKISGRTDTEREVTGCALISMQLKEENNKVFFNIDIAQGIDPSLVMCFTAAADEILEQSMRRQCHARSANSPNRPKHSPSRSGRHMTAVL